MGEFEGFGLGSWKVWDSFQNFKQTSSEEASTADFYTIQPTFTIKDLAKAEPFMKKCVDLTKNEAGCMYYGWTRSSSTARRRAGRRSRKAPTRSAPSTGTATPASPSSRCELYKPRRD